jgi:hypothetical protein
VGRKRGKIESMDAPAVEKEEKKRLSAHPSTGSIEKPVRDG